MRRKRLNVAGSQGGRPTKEATSGPEQGVYVLVFGICSFKFYFDHLPNIFQAWVLISILNGKVQNISESTHN